MFHDEVGYNFKMPSLNASLGLAQLRELKTQLKKRLLYKKYDKVFKNDHDYKMMKEPINI